MAWAPSVVWNDEEQQYYVFWSSRLYDPADTVHTGTSTSGFIRYTTTTDFMTFATPSSYTSSTSVDLIDQEFQYLGTPGRYARFLKDEIKDKVYQETTTDGLFGTWTRNEVWVVDEGPYEGAAAFADILNPDVYYLLLDNYKQYVPFTTSDILSNAWEPADASSFPTGVKHGSVFQVTQDEYDAIAAAYS